MKGRPCRCVRPWVGLLRDGKLRRKLSKPGKKNKQKIKKTCCENAISFLIPGLFFYIISGLFFGAVFLIPGLIFYLIPGLNFLLNSGLNFLLNSGLNVLLNSGLNFIT